MIYKTRHFARWARKAGLNDSLLETAVLEIQSGLLEADLGGGIVKKLARDLLGMTAKQITAAVGEGSLVEVEHEVLTAQEPPFRRGA